ncbi:MAG: site-specific DNA-methyltransferase [Cytophagales bacterium]|nr:site-specific DNA-methyltransferase [Cytophagales bacterium]
MNTIPENKIIQGDSLILLNDLGSNSIPLILTSPPYFLCRDYGNGALGREANPLDYVKNMLLWTKQLKRVLAKEGSFYFNIGDVYFGTKGFIRNKGQYARKTDIHYKEHKIVKPDGAYLQYKQSLMLPERIAIGMQEQGWILRNKIIWEKPNPVPSYSPDRRYPVYEHIFHFVKSRKYYFDLVKAKELGHHRDVIKCGIEPFGKHQASFPVSLLLPFIETTSKIGDLVLDPFMGSGSVAIAALMKGRRYLGFEINPEFCILAEERIKHKKVFLSHSKAALYKKEQRL